MHKISKGSLYGEAAARIRDLITEGRLEAGARIPEKELCEQFGISRTPLREALKVLASEGFVELLPNRGARVTKITRRVLADTYNVMAALEGAAGELTCQIASDREIAEIKALHYQMLAHFTRRDAQPYFELNQKIHDAIVDAAGNKVLSEVYHNLNARVRRTRYTTRMTEEQWTQAVADHEAMIEALEDRDGRRLGEILRGHLRHKLDIAEAVADGAAACLPKEAFLAGADSR